MDRGHAIKFIESLYPADSQYKTTAAIGQQLLEQAKRDVSGWRSEPTPVLVRYAQLCIQEGNRNASI